MDKPGKIKVLHLIDGLGGGSEEWVKEIVRLSVGERFEYMVAGIVPGESDPFTYGEEIENLGVKVVSLEGEESAAGGTGIEGEISFIKDVMAQQTGSSLADALWGTVKFSVRNGKMKNLTMTALKALTLLARLSVLVRREKIDVIHAHLFYAFMFGGLAGKVLHVPVVYSVPARCFPSLGIPHVQTVRLFGGRFHDRHRNG